MKKLPFFLFLVAFLKTNAQDIHGDLENWRTLYAGSAQLESPQGWYSDDSVIFMSKFVFPNANYSQQTFKTTDTHSGNYAAKIVTANQDVFGTTPGVLTNTKPVIDMAKFNSGQNPVVYTGGTNVTERVKSVKAWVKYIPNGVDTSSIYIEAVLVGKGANGLDSFAIVGEGVAYITDSLKDYAQIDVPVSYINPNTIPERLLIFFTSSNNSPVAGSALYVDDINIATPSGTEEIFHKENTIGIYPNPTNGMVFISNQNHTGSDLQIYSTTGQLIESRTIENQKAIDLSFLTPGLYHYRISGKNGLFLKAGEIIIER